MLEKAGSDVTDLVFRLALYECVAKFVNPQYDDHSVV